MKRVLIPTDFSSNAWHALEYAMQLCHDQICVFYLLNTYTPTIPNSRFLAPLNDGVRKAVDIRTTSLRGLEATVNKVKKKYPNEKHTFKTLSSFNLLVDEVLDVINTLKIDLVIIGAKGASGNAEIFMGSNTVKLLKKINNCPVLAIPQASKYFVPTDIVFATDFSRFYSASELTPLNELARTFNSVIRIVHVQYEIKPLSEAQRFNLNMLRKYLKGVDHFIHTVSKFSSLSTTLAVLSKEMDIHLLALLNYQHSCIEQVIREPMVKKTAFQTQIPLFVLPEFGVEKNPAMADKNTQELTFRH